MFGSAMTDEVLERDIAMMKTLGANLVRFPYPPNPYMLNLCDRYGLLAMEEIPLVDVPAEILSKDYYQELATNYAREMVDRDKLHVSVLAWGIGDEFESGSPGSCEYVNDMRNIIKSLDSRTVYFATHRMKDPCFDNVDLIALNSYGESASDFRDALKQCRVSYPDKPIIIARYGREIEPSNHNGYSDPLSLESQARYAMQFFNLMQDTKIAGGVLCSFSDWRADRAALTTHSRDPYLHAMGLVSFDREKRTAFDVVRSLFHGEKVQALPIGNYSSNAPIIFVVAGFVILISFAFVYNANRRFRDCVNRSLFRTYNFFADVRDLHLLTYSQSVFVGLVVSVTWATLLSSVFAYYRDNLLLDNLLSQFMTDGVKERFILLVWSPLEFIVVMSGLIFAMFVLIAFVVKILSMTIRTRVRFYHAFAVTMWSLLPFIVLIPVAMVLFRLMDSELYVMPAFAFMVLVNLWVLFRLLKGISIIYDIFPVKVYAFGLLIIIVASAVVYGYFDYTKSTTAYLKYMIQTMKNST
jgi:beta-galactosidase